MKQALNFFIFYFCRFVIFSQVVEKPHIFLIISDDLNDYPLDINGHPQISTPGIESIAALGTSFLNAQASAPKCGPSRTSFITGKDLFYTQVYFNPACKPFRDYFTAAKNNEEVFTLPEHLKNNGYFTYGINKMYHCYSTYPDFDTVNTDPCARGLSWSKYSWFNNIEDTSILNYGDSHHEGIPGLQWAVIPDSFEHHLYDYMAIDSALSVIDQFQNETINTCGDPLFITIGLRKPHGPWYIPAKYFSADYVSDFYAEPFNYPYNDPKNQFPYNGVVMPPQPDTLYNDYNKLGPLGKSIADSEVNNSVFDSEVSNFSPIPVIDPLLSDEERIEIVKNSLKANSTIGYIAAVEFVDTQIKRFIDSLQSYPEILNNSILIFISDHGYSLGEKNHWTKSTMWENDLRVPFIIADMRNPLMQSTLSVVSLLDLFPTICDIIDIPCPTFADGSNYLDGKSLMPLINNPNAMIDKPALAAYKLTDHVQCSCFPQYSVRNNSFHYIYYTSNNADTLLDCNAASAWHEEELYEIGKCFQTDPNEWNNLAHDTAYQQVKNYLQQWLPDSSMYLQIPFSINIQNNLTDCLLDQSDTLQLYFNLYDTVGILISPPENSIYRWTNNLTNDVFTDQSIIFPINLIPNDLFNSKESILFILQMIDTINYIVVGLDTKTFYINSENEPTIVFSVFTDSLTVTVEDIVFTGNYNLVTWNFGDGTFVSGPIPPTHSYSGPGTFTITCTLSYGNYPSCEKLYSLSNTITMLTELNNNFHLFPNPGQDIINLEWSPNVYLKNIRITNLTGQIIFSKQVKNTGAYQIDVSSWPAGHFLIQFTTNSTMESLHLEVIH